MAEVRTVNPIYTYFVGFKGDGMGFLWINDEVDIVVFNAKAMR